MTVRKIKHISAIEDSKGAFSKTSYLANERIIIAGNSVEHSLAINGLVMLPLLENTCTSPLYL